MKLTTVRNVVISTVVAFALVACKQAEVPEDSEELVEAIAEEDTAIEDEAVDKNLLGDEESIATEASSEFDIDLTTMSSTMVYAEVYNIVMSPKDYIGKTVKMSGECMITPSEDNTKVYYACLIKDATACCSQGLEFELEDDNNYPEAGETVTVSGVFGTYEENGVLYCHLENAKRYE